jgi:two-component system chemotaxis response regulator CheV
VNDLEEIGERERCDDPILIAEDSPLLSTLITDCLKKAGYVKQIVTFNGQEAWEKILQFDEEGTLDEKVHCVITDIEMPKMDGHRLTKLIKSNDSFKHIPVIIFSSLVNDEMKRKGEQLGADAQLTKPEIGKLVDAIDNLLAKSRQQKAE